ncbi:MAG: hypothetical protein ACLFQ2_03435 [Wenzhouxiangella sp.]
MKTTARTLFFLLLLALFSAGALTGCEEPGPAEQTGEEIDEAVEEAGDEVEEMGDEVEEDTD